MIIKLINKTSFAQIPNKTLRDKRLSLEARGMLAEILSYSAEFETSVESLMKMLEIGRKKLLRLTSELKRNGYLAIENIQGRNGQIVDKEWQFYAESQEIDFSTNYVRRNFTNFKNPSQADLFDQKFLSDQDACLGYVGEKETAVDGHHHIDKYEPVLNTDLKELEKKSLSQSETNESESEIKKVEKIRAKTKSQFSMSEIVKYVQTLMKNGADIRNPSGYAFTISQSSDSDAFILAALYPERLETDLDTNGEPRQFSAEPCSVCNGTKWETIKGAGAKKCKHCLDEKGSITGFEPLESYLQTNLKMLRSELDSGEDIAIHQDFYTEETWQWLMDNLNQENSS